MFINNFNTMAEYYIGKGKRFMFESRYDEAQNSFMNALDSIMEENGYIGEAGYGYGWTYDAVLDDIFEHPYWAPTYDMAMRWYNIALERSYKEVKERIRAKLNE